MKFARCIALAVALGCFPAVAADDDDVSLTPAIQAANAWLALIDAQRYGDSWDRASQLFQDATERVKWEAKVQAARGPLGIVQGRKMHSATYARAVPGAPAGDYVVIRYETHFLNRAFSTETVTPSREKDGTWKVSGYIIQ